ncbi:MAG: 23S rRNA (guanosine(2251)-2'-O)-methyltransferase RlmB [Pseudomonadota bacterium]
MARKPAWVVEKERAENASVWLFGLHAVRDALANPARRKLRLILTKNAADRLSDVLATCDIPVEQADARKFPAPLDPGSVHQGAALEVRPLAWGGLEQVVPETGPSLVLLLDRVTDPHNVGAILRSAEVFGASAVIAPARHSAPETGALAKTASGALERQPYIRVKNLSQTIEEMKKRGFQVIGLDGQADVSLEISLTTAGNRVALVLGAEGPGLREKTRDTCDRLARIPSAGAFGSLNVSNAAAVSLYAVARQETS